MTNELREALEKISRSLDAEISAHRCGCTHPCEDYLVHPGPCGTRTAEAFRNIKVIADKALASLSASDAPATDRDAVIEECAIPLMREHVEFDAKEIGVTLKQEPQPKEAPTFREPIAFGSPAPSAGDGWQPIATAPKDGTRILVADTNMWMTVARNWPCNGYWIEDAASGMKLNDPTHWRPLPSPPNQESETR